MALGIEEITREVGEAKLHEAEFMLANNVEPPEAVGHVTCKEKKARQTDRQIPVEATGWICSARKGSVVHRNRGCKPAYQESRVWLELISRVKPRWCAPSRRQRLWQR